MSQVYLTMINATALQLSKPELVWSTLLSILHFLTYHQIKSVEIWMDFDLDALFLIPVRARGPDTFGVDFIITL